MHKSKQAFTMIELIFVIVVLGILASVAIPKLAASRNDASASVVALSLGDCIEMAGGSYGMTEAFDMNSASCDIASVDNLCFTFTPSNATGVLNVKDVAGVTNGSVCKLAQTLVSRNSLSSAGGIDHQF